MKGDTDSCSMCPSRVFHLISFFFSNGHIHSATGLPGKRPHMDYWQLFIRIHDREEGEGREEGTRREEKMNKYT